MTIKVFGVIRDASPAEASTTDFIPTWVFFGLGLPGGKLCARVMPKSISLQEKISFNLQIKKLTS
jgi:hypothetical protein